MLFGPDPYHHYTNRYLVRIIQIGRVIPAARINLTHMWKAAGGSKNQMSLQWLRIPSTVKFIETLAKKNLKVVLTHY